MRLRRSLYLFALGVLSVSCTSGAAETTTANEDSTQAATSTTTSSDPFAGTWVAEDSDGSLVELTLSRDGTDGYVFTYTDGHAGVCADFGVPTSLAGEGHGTLAEDGLDLEFISVACDTDWGIVPLQLDLSARLTPSGDQLLDGAGLCFEQDAPGHCEGQTSTEMVNSEPDYAALAATYGQQWLVDNFQGDTVPEAILALSDPCRAPEGAPPGELIVTSTEIPDLPRALTCSAHGVWVYQRLTNSALLLDASLNVSLTLEGIGSPSGNKDLVVFHTFNTVDVIVGDDTLEPTRLADYPDSDFVRAAVPMGSDKVLVATNGLTLLALDGSVVWTIDGEGYGDLVEGDDEFWAATSSGKLARIPKDGSEPMVFDVPDAVWGGSASLRPTPRLAPVERGVYITNADDTVQLITDQGEKSARIDVGPPPKGDGAHIIPVRPLRVVGEWVYTEDADGNVFRFKSDGSTKAELYAGTAPFTETSQLTWHFESGAVVTRDAEGAIVHNLHIGAAGENWIWTGTSLFVTYQGGHDDPGGVIEIRAEN